MPRHPWSVRLLRACLALWFVVCGGELGLVHGCAMHDAAGGHAHAHAMPPGSHHAAHAGAGHDAPAPQPAHACTCVGTCSAATAVALVSPPAVATARYARAVRAPLPDAARPPSARGAHVLPFANGPPPVRATA